MWLLLWLLLSLLCLWLLGWLLRLWLRLFLIPLSPRPRFGRYAFAIDTTPPLFLPITLTALTGFHEGGRCSSAV